MKQVIIGRIEEMKMLDALLRSDRPELAAIYGRRRVGKTYLIKNYYAANLKFICSGESGGSMNIQLANRQGGAERTEPYNTKKKESLFRLIDEFSLFYFRFMQGSKLRNNWLSISKTGKYSSWCGYAFENICFKHILQITKALGISGIHTVYSSWYRAGCKNSEGAQIDLLLDRGMIPSIFAK